MTLSAVRVLEALRDAHIAPEGVLGGSRIQNKDQLLKVLRNQARFLTTVLLITYLSQVALVVTAVVLALTPPSKAPNGVLPYLSGTVLIALLEFSRRVTREWMTITLALRVAPHATNEQLADLISNLLVAFKKPAEGRPPALAPGKK